MILVHQVKCHIPHKDRDLMAALCKKLRIGEKDVKGYTILRRSLDARKKPELYYLYSLLVTLSVSEDKVLQKLSKDRDVSKYTKEESSFYPSRLDQKAVEGREPVVIVGAGPAGLFCAWELVQAGLHPLILERGKKVEERSGDVDTFWETGVLDPSSNVQFGEGGAGTFSDGKLNTLVKDTSGKNKKVLKIFVEYGAKESILYDQKPHLGTDVLKTVITGIRKDLSEKGATFRFGAQVTDITIQDGR